jgi:hypothetical protein
MNGHWYRLEPSNRAPILEPGLGVAVADAMWMLARQWQAGEFRGEDAARPIRCRYEVERVPLSHWFADPDVVTAMAAKPLPNPPVPIEVHVEQEQLTDGSSAFAFAAEAGVQLLRQLRVSGVTEPTRRKIAAAFAFGAVGVLGPTAAVVARRAPDGASAYAARAGIHQRAIIPEADRAATQAAVIAWAAWYESRCEEPSPSDESVWRDERLAYRFALATRPKGSPALVLTADDHAGGALDWHAFDLAVQPRLALTQSASTTDRGEVFPAPVRYGGMPAPRWWTFEDTTVHFGDISSGPADLARMVVAEFASVYSNDWWMIPVRVVAGHLHRVTSVEVVDSFGDTHDIPPGTSTSQGAWKFFELTGDPSAGAGQAPWLLVLDTAAGAAEGDPVETVEFVRDEQNNLGWAGECTYEAVDGRTHRRMDEWRGTDGSVDGEAASGDAWRYVFSAHGAPPLWAPLVPERPDPTEPAVVLRRARMRDWDQLPAEVVRLRGRILAPDRPFMIDEVELPRSGLTVTRSYQTVRDRQGRLRAWAGRRKRLGRGERTVGSRYDRIVT